ncbi:hypothetical protein [Pedobacter sp. V48]|uniref:hypothetical protein n=1 Tax=Pedobacter sp. V48 TaxID=509635 RepID=UPI0003E57BE0|nr:hypothetical protein [Pedobacter sp. V48]ETZ21803.1 hypothetical protein N824_26565 [Pedobacter sp. V48]
MKHLSKTAICLALLALSAHTFGQRKFVGRLLDANRKPVVGMSLRVVNIGVAKSGTSGNFDVSIPENSDVVTLELVGSKLSIIYPFGGIAKVPKNKDEQIEFYIGESPTNLLTRAVAKSNNEMKENLSKLGIKSDDMLSTLKSYREAVEKLIDIKLDNLSAEEELDNQRKDFYPTLSKAINNFINEAKDLKDAFKFSTDHAFDDPQALEILTRSINSYNDAYEEINKNHSSYEKNVKDYWANESKETEVKEWFNYALGELHSSNIFILNLKIKDINDYNTANLNKTEKKALRTRVLHEIEVIDLQLDRRLQELDKRAEVLLNRLAN